MTPRDDFGGLGLMRYYNAAVRWEMAVRRAICAVIGHRLTRPLGDPLGDEARCQRCGWAR